ncbi:VWA domain-containing protein [Sandaracinobacter sp. RS1-74]|uniref:vWA domain-containing protein n=1 Tax=Sandaracinobacteroides sayramensis TaxID=2913411 RepID=UPI001EDA5C03|nr:VWA domain-containing protein [Sandaracinobacteroides sayramensis]MCG2841153.1 VWA domain-containing protein [Sandaracinobacteroides sayramensis]
MAEAPTHLPQDRESYPGATPNPIRQVAQEPVSTFSIDVDTAAYSNVRRFLNRDSLPPRDAVRVEELLNYFDYGYRAPARGGDPFAATVSVVPSPWSKGHRLLHIGLQGFELPKGEQPPLNLVFLIDTSGSMMGPDRLPLAKKAMDILVEQLGKRDRVAIVAYAGSAGAVLEPVDGLQKTKIRCALDYLEAGGSTAGGRGLELAYALARQNFDPKAVNRVVLLTDGDFNVGVASPERMRDLVSEQRGSGVYLSVYGFGRGNYQDRMMQALAQNGNGTAAYIDSFSEAKKLFLTDFAKGMFPIADDVKIQVEFNPATVREYRLIGYETRMLAREDFNNDRVDAGEVGSGAAVTAIYEIVPAGASGSVDPLRYGKTAAKAGKGGEYAFLKLRYKRPGEAVSRLMQRPIGAGDHVAKLAAAPEATRWAVAVAGFGERLRGSPHLEPGFGLPQVAALAESAKGADPHGERAEFVTLVRRAEKLLPEGRD